MWTKVGSVAGAITSFTDTRLTEGTEYSFRVSAENEVGISEPLEMDKSFIAKSIYGRYYNQNYFCMLGLNQSRYVYLNIFLHFCDNIHIISFLIR